MLADELGLEPGPELRRLQEAILAHDPAIAAVPVVAQAPRQSARALDLVRRPRGRARPGRRAAARAPPRDAHRPARRGQEPARGRGRALARGRVPGRHLARRLRARGRRGRRRPAPRPRRRRSRRRPARARDLAASRRRRARRSRRVRARARRGSADRARRSSRSAPAVRILATSREALHVASEVRVPVAAARGARRSSSSSSVRARHGPDSSRTPRPSRSPRRSPGASTDCRSRSSSPPRA